MDRQRNRTALIGVLFVTFYLIRRESGQPPPKLLPHDELKTPKKYKVFGFRSVLALQNSSSAKLVPAAHHEKHDREVIWSTQSKVIEEALALAIESMYARLLRQGKVKPQKNKKPNEDQMKAAILNFTQDELNIIDPGWQIFILDPSDGGMGVWPYWYIQEEMAPLLGWNRINYATRSTQNDRNTDLWVRKVNENIPSLTLDGFIGAPINFTAMILEGKNILLDKGCRSIQRLSLGVREDIVQAIDEYMKENHRTAYEEASNNALGIEDTRFRLSPAVARLSRTMDVRTFWNATVCNLHCKFRNHVAEIVASISRRHPDSGIQTNTKVIGFIHTQGRQRVHPDYIGGMMTTKIIVLAQRDHWEGHIRLYEALLSGALVMSDPQIYWPHGTIDNENIVVYNSWPDLELKILYYIDPKNEEERTRIGQRGREVALTHHRSWQQAERLFLNDMKYRNDYGLANKPWSANSDYVV